jgi:quercetin dioxygenase-like cupin family protein
MFLFCLVARSRALCVITIFAWHNTYMETRRDLIKLAAASTLALPFAAKAGGLPSTVHTPAEASLVKHPFGDERIFYIGPTAQLKSMTAGNLLLHPGQEPHPPHQHPEEEFILVTEGEGEIMVGGVTHKVQPGSMMYCEGNQVHGVKNTTTAPFVFYYYKWQA